jgi:hypothetical protein
MLRVNANFKWMKDHLLFEMGEEIITQLKMDFMQWWDVNGIFFLCLLISNFPTSSIINSKTTSTSEI